MLRVVAAGLLFLIPSAGATCPTGFLGPSPDNKCYLLSETKYNYANGLAYCQANSLLTPVILNSDENDFIRGEITDRTWIGGNDFAKEGTFVWSATGRTFTYTNWDSSTSEPNNQGGEEHCAEMLSWGPGLWNDAVCSDLFNVICFECVEGEKFSQISQQCTNETQLAPVNIVGHGSIGVPYDGEVQLYHQFIDTSTGTESFHRYMDLGFVEADEDIHRVTLVSFSDPFPPHSFLPQ